MRTFRLAVIMGILSTASLVSSYFYYHAALKNAEAGEKKYHAITGSRSERKAYKDRLSAFDEQWKSIGRISWEKAADISYEITICPASFGELNEKIVSTYEQGIFFLNGATIESTPEGTRLMVTGAKKGGGNP